MQYIYLYSGGRQSVKKKMHKKSYIIVISVIATMAFEPVPSATSMQQPVIVWP